MFGKSAPFVLFWIRCDQVFSFTNHVLKNILIRQNHSPGSKDTTLNVVDHGWSHHTKLEWGWPQHEAMSETGRCSRNHAGAFPWDNTVAHVLFNRHRLNNLWLGPQILKAAALKQWFVFPLACFFGYVEGFNFTSTLSGKTNGIRKGLLKRSSSTGILIGNPSKALYFYKIKVFIRKYFYKNELLN